MSILKTVMPILLDDEEPDSSDVETRLFLGISPGEGLTPARVALLIKKLEKYLAWVERDKRRLEKIKRDYEYKTKAQFRA